MVILSSHTAVTPHPPAVVFARWADPATWPEWDPDVMWVRFAGPAAMGARGKLKSTSGPPLPFRVTAFEDERVFTNTGELPAARLVFEHHVTGVPGGSEVTVSIDLHGRLARLWRRVIGASLRDAARSSVDGLITHLNGRR